MRVIFLASEFVSHDYFIAPNFSFTKLLCYINHYIRGKEGPIDGSIWTASFGFTHCWLQHDIILCLIKIWLFPWNLVALQKLPFDWYIFGIKRNLVQWFSNYLNWVFSGKPQGTVLGKWEGLKPESEPFHPSPWALMPFICKILNKI